MNDTRKNRLGHPWSLPVRLAVATGVILASAGVTVLTTTPADALPNSCADPYWQYTLRCAMFPGDIPQPNAGVGPAAGDVRDFTRVFLNDDPSLRSLDGTRPVMYLDKAACTNPAGCNGVPEGAPIESDKWIFSMTGGGSCHAKDTTGAEVFDDAKECLDLYSKPVERDEMGTASEPPMKELFGINRPDPVGNPVFAGYNRVWIEKSSYDWYGGRVAYTAPNGYFHETDSSGNLLDFDMYQQGYRIIEEALRALTPGLTYTTWTTSGGGQEVEEAEETLPALANAEAVLFVGHSGGAGGLYYNIDHLAQTLRSIPNFAGDIRAAFDAHFQTSIENEAAFKVKDPANLLPAHAYGNDWSGQTVGDGVAFSYDGAQYLTTGEVDEQFRSWDVKLDASCVADHATAGDGWKCRDAQHLVLNHIATPFFFREDFSDPNPGHTDDKQGLVVHWADPSSWGAYAHCPDPAVPCPPHFSYDAGEHRIRLEELARVLRNQSRTDSALATSDPSLGGDVPTVYAWMPDCGVHAGAFNNDSFATTITDSSSTYSMREWLERFMGAPPANVQEARIDGLSTGRPMTTGACPA